MDDCIFCQVIAGKLPSTKEYEDDEVVVIRDLNPVAPLHVLIIPKAHLAEMDPASYAASGGKLLKVAAEMASWLGIEQSYRLVINKGKWVQSVPHLHIHLMGGWQSPEEIPGVRL